MISCSKNKVKKVPATKNGPKGISDFKPFFPEKIKITPITAPIKNAKNKAVIILGNPKNKPIKKASFTSPIPIHLPCETKTIKRKNNEAPSAEYSPLSMLFFV